MTTGLSKSDKFLALALFAFVLLIGFTRLWETDTWWHIKTGEIIAQKQALPDKDVFSYTRPDNTWVHDEWLGEMYLFGIYQKHGISGIIILSALCGACIFYFAFSAGKMRGAPVALAAVITAIASVAARTRITPRPDVFALLFFSADIYLLNKFICSNADDRRAHSFLWIIPVIQLFWVNSHPSGLIGVALVALLTLCGFAVFFLRRIDKRKLFPLSPEIDSTKMKLLGILFLTTFFISFLNQYHFHSLAAPFEFASTAIYRVHIAEWAPIPMGELFSLKGDAQTNCLKILLLFGIIAGAASIRMINLFDTLLFLGTAFMAISSRRFIAMFAISSVPFIASGLAAAAGSFKFAPGLALPAKSAAFVFLSVLCIQQLRGDPRLSFGIGADTRRLPDAAVDFIRLNRIDGHIYNDYSLGGYLIWKLYPANKVFIDGRTTFYGPSFYSEYIDFESHPTPATWRSLENRYGIDYAALSVSQRSVRDAIIFSSADWRLVFWDNNAMILLKNTPKFAGIIEKNQYRLTEPYTVMNLLPSWDKAAPDTRSIVVSELERNLKQSPDCILALRALSFIYMKAGDVNRAEALAAHGISVAPDTAGLHALLGEIAFKRGAKDDARRHFRDAARIDKKYNNIVKQIEE